MSSWEYELARRLKQSQRVDSKVLMVVGEIIKEYPLTVSMYDGDVKQVEGKNLPGTSVFWGQIDSNRNHIDTNGFSAPIPNKGKKVLLFGYTGEGDDFTAISLM